MTDSGIRVADAPAILADHLIKRTCRSSAETCFQKFDSDNLQRLRGLSEADLTKEFVGLKLDLRQDFVSTGMGDLQSKLLTVAEAKKRKADVILQSRKKQSLLQADQLETRGPGMAADLGDATTEGRYAPYPMRITP